MDNFLKKMAMDDMSDIFTGDDNFVNADKKNKKNKKDKNKDNEYKNEGKGEFKYSDEDLLNLFGGKIDFVTEEHTGIPYQPEEEVSRNLSDEDFLIDQRTIINKKYDELIKSASSEITSENWVFKEVNKKGYCLEKYFKLFSRNPVLDGINHVTNPDNYIDMFERKIDEDFEEALKNGYYYVRWTSDQVENYIQCYVSKRLSNIIEIITIGLSTMLEDFEKELTIRLNKQFINMTKCLYDLERKEEKLMILKNSCDEIIKEFSYKINDYDDIVKECASYKVVIKKKTDHIKKLYGELNDVTNTFFEKTKEIIEMKKKKKKLEEEKMTMSSIIEENKKTFEERKKIFLEDLKKINKQTYRYHKYIFRELDYNEAEDHLFKTLMEINKDGNTFTKQKEIIKQAPVIESKNRGKRHTINDYEVAMIIKRESGVKKWFGFNNNSMLCKILYDCNIPIKLFNMDEDEMTMEDMYFYYPYLLKLCRRTCTKQLLKAIWLKLEKNGHNFNKIKTKYKGKNFRTILFEKTFGRFFDINNEKLLRKTINYLTAVTGKSSNYIYHLKEGLLNKKKCGKK